jgi:hypothetical protein
MQPVIRINDDGERKIEIMSGASKERMASSSSMPAQKASQT